MAAQESPDTEDNTLEFLQHAVKMCRSEQGKTKALRDISIFVLGSGKDEVGLDFKNDFV